MRLTKVYLWSLAGALGVVLLAVPVMWYFGFSGTMWLERLLPSLALFLIYIVVALACAVAHDSGAAPQITRVGIVLATLAFIGWVIPLWYEPVMMSDDLFTWPMAVIWPSMWSLWCAAVGVLMMIQPRAKPWIMLRRITLAALAGLALAIGVIVMLETDWSTGENLLNIWWRRPDRSLVLQTVMLSLPMGFVLGVIGIVGLMHIRHGSKAVRIPAMIVAPVSILLAVVVLASRTTGYWPSYGRRYGYERSSAYEVWETLSAVTGFGLGTVAAVLLLLTLGTAVLLKLNNRPLYLPQPLAFDMTCPRCNEDQQAMVGEHHCSRCGLVVRVELV